MRLRFVNHEGKDMAAHLGSRPAVIGRSAEADIRVPDDNVSRFHCEIRLWGGDYVVKDLRSSNGTFINDVKVAVALLEVGDTLRIGPTVFRAEKEPPPGASAILRAEVEKEVARGKGYGTILKEIIEDTDEAKESGKGK